MGKVALITGGSRGIGKAIAIEFAKRAYDVVINYKEHEQEALALKTELEKKYSISVLLEKADVSSLEDVESMVDDVMNTYGRIDVLVNNAGIAIDKEFCDRTVSDFEKTLSTNLIGPFIVSKLVGSIMMENRGGKIINISSTNGIHTFFPTSIDYDASKAGVINLTHNLAIQFAPYVNVNCVAPGWVNTDMNKDLPKELLDEELEKIYLKRFAEPEDIAKVVFFLASDDARYINGEVIKVDGGY